ncbi:hypothetical protein ACHAC9_09525 [Massilia sp. CMS3.1]|uniref:hypothetical protein n=1 Tax=Massilia sp. CMS3.1 TaxID=3373083 RepID=UPI003EE78B5A
MKNVKKSLKNAGLCLAAVLLAGSVQAAVIFTPGVAPAPATVENVRFDPTRTGVVNGPGTTVTGVTARTDYLVDFSADELLIAFENPAALPAVPPTVRATDGALRSLDIDVRDGAFSTVFYNLFVSAVGGNPTGRFADILVGSFDGTTTSYRQQLRNGFNLLTITADNETLLRDVSIFANSDFADIRQIRFGGLQAAPIPEPGIFMSFSLAGFALWRVCARRRSGPRADHHLAQA